ncbi:MAG: YihY family inner membrane protein [Rhodocyclales bacterium]|nr:YihY family inner membrane protein [Rhodocyclales bacterium]
MAVSRPFLIPFLLRIVRRFGEEDFDQISASLAFTTLISLVPLAALILALVSAFPAFANFVDHVDKLLVAHLLPAGSAGLISGKLLQFSRRAAEVSAFGVAVLVVTTFLLMNTVERAFNHVWQVRVPRPMWQRLGLYAVVVAVWPVFIGALLAATSSALTASFGLLGELRWIRAPLFKGFSLAVLILFFAFLYHAVPNAVVRWRHAFIAGAFAALGFLLLQKSFELYLTYFPSYKAVYGAFAALPIFLLWVYLSWAVVLLGGLVAATLPEFGQSPGRRRRRV